MQQELKDKIMEALHEALVCGSEMLSSTSNDFKVQEIGERLVHTIDDYIQPENKIYQQQCKDWARACKMTLSSLNPPC